MVDLSTKYLGLTLKNPVVASSSPFSKKVENVKRLEDTGASAVVMYSLFEEQIIHESKALDHFLNRGTESFAEALTYFPDFENYNVGPESYLDLIQKLKISVEIPIIGSLNGVSRGGWINYARKIEEAGADALELNIYSVPTDFSLNSSQLEDEYVALVSEVRKEIHIPLAIKLSPYYTSLPHFAQQLVKAGANGLTLFNRFYQPDIDIEEQEVVPNLILSDPGDMRLPLRWIAILSGRLQTDLALTSGVHSGEDVLKAVMAGANVAMLTSELLRSGSQRLTEILCEIERWMEKLECESITQIHGSMSQKNVADPAAFERANYMKVLTSFDGNILF
ncbi:MAG: dihydroorotate dehydrogenase-like protein [Anaerolineaceae bacterium]